MTKNICPVDEILSPVKMLTLGFQHVLVMYAGTIAVPLVFGSKMGLSQKDIILLINATLFMSGVATLSQTIGFWKIGARIPLIQGCSFIALTPMLIIGQQYGIQYVFGSIITCGALTIVIAPLFSKLLRFFPPVVTGTLIIIIGLSLIPAAAEWLGGGNPNAADFGNISHLTLGFSTITIILIIYRCFSGFLANNSILIGLLGGTSLAAISGETDFSSVRAVSWFAFIKPFAFGFPKFSPTPIILISLVMIVIMAETTGTSMAIGKLVDRKITSHILTNTFRSNGLSTMLGGLFNSFAYNAFMQNTGLIALTGVKSRYIVATSGGILIFLSFFPKLASILSAVPPPVLGGAALIMFGMTIATGIQQLSQIRYEGTHNSIIIAASLGIGIIPTSFPDLFSKIDGPLKIISDSGALMGALTAVLLNAFLNQKIEKKLFTDPHSNKSLLKNDLTSSK
ncbi:MAG: Uracil-xanthine permease [Candidatus Tokpelaia sp. JSC161]|jgi:NCS2 family nucleobase:cation symporter-2|nr:MAG: Uracil-xanthine permease [Candidatus Tokpelaia sp. JSC161]